MGGHETGPTTGGAGILRNPESPPERGKNPPHAHVSQGPSVPQSPTRHSPQHQEPPLENRLFLPFQGPRVLPRSSCALLSAPLGGAGALAEPLGVSLHQGPPLVWHK